MIIGISYRAEVQQHIEESWSVYNIQVWIVLQQPIKREEVNKSPKEVLHSYPLDASWHPQEAFIVQSNAKSMHNR